MCMRSCRSAACAGVSGRRRRKRGGGSGRSGDGARSRERSHCWAHRRQRRATVPFSSSACASASAAMSCGGARVGRRRTRRRDRPSSAAAAAAVEMMLLLLVLVVVTRRLRSCCSCGRCCCSCSYSCRSSRVVGCVAREHEALDKRLDLSARALRGGRRAHVVQDVRDVRLEQRLQAKAVVAPRVRGEEHLEVHVRLRGLSRFWVVEVRIIYTHKKGNLSGNGRITSTNTRTCRKRCERSTPNSCCVTYVNAVSESSLRALSWRRSRQSLAASQVRR